MEKGDDHEVTAFVSGEDCTPADTGNVVLTVERERDHVFIGNQREQLQKEPAQDCIYS